ncbi:TPA: hypothetical protein DCZ15_04200 [Candidatus Falkowbacteria bacterium]|nr:MAG: hypothetical protein UV95_C0001G0333 [Candidatus Falkowbacteria bacterium GW2011_GWF2_43_32]HBA37039.1 hypothetical protein [Candidatus Falkowbacteria bacterium]
MSRWETFEKISKGCSAHENTGSRLEEEFIGGVNNHKYKELAYQFIHQKETPEHLDAEKKYQWILKTKEKAQKELQETSALFARENYINFKDSMELVEKCQIGNPEKPSKFFSRALYNKIKNRFQDKYLLKFFTATGGTHLDVVHGIDCFFKLYDKESGQELTSATIDFTKRPGKDSAKADLIFFIDDNDQTKYDPSPENQDFDKNAFDRKIEEFSEQTVETLIENYKKISLKQ